jgi:DNA-directed RNA polymerase specialized sigma24 family protein
MKPVDSAKAILEETDWVPLLKRLTAYALKLGRELPAVFDGISPDDLVGETFVSYLASPNRLNWDPRQGSLEAFLCGVLTNKFLMHARRYRHCAGTAEDDRTLPEVSSPVAQNGATPSSIFADRI